MVSKIKIKPTRRALLRGGLVSGGFFLCGLGELPWAASEQTRRRNDPFAAGKQVGVVEFVHEGRVPMDLPLGAELDGRLYTDLSELTPKDEITLTEKFYLRTRASKLLPAAKSWNIRIHGIVAEPSNITLESLKKTVKPMGVHLMECAGNLNFAGFGMISTARWGGVELTSLLENANVKMQASRIMISGFDEYESESASSVPGASWIFSQEELHAARAFLATEMNGQTLSADHGAPVRLVVPGWYGCACIKWVDSITLVADNVEATSQMKEYAARTHQSGVPALAGEYQPAIIDQAAMPIRVEKWLISGKIKYRVVGIAWGGSQHVEVLQIRFNPEEDYVPVDQFKQLHNDPWTLWSYAWSPSAPGAYTIRLAVKEPQLRTRRLDSGYYARSVEITEV